ncbi:MAG: peptidyl-prolyl cis-trans isomerase D [Alphaproteobacteria bacterium]|jgi:peptidyl-prolyl cis-trans isomerase D
MLQALRNQASSWVIKILLGFLILSFAVWGINDIFLGERDPVVATVGDAKLKRSTVLNAVREEIYRLQPLFGGRLDRAQASRMGIEQQVLDNLINRTAVEQGARDLGIIISDALVARRIKSDETFFNSQGQFDHAIFGLMLSQNSMNEAYYVATLKRDLASAEINRAVSAAVSTPKAMVDPLVGFRSERREAKFIKLPTVTTVKEPTSIEVQAFYKANSQRFMAPQLRDVTWIHLDPAAMASEIRVPEDHLKQAYAERKDEFSSNERRDIEQVVFRSQAAAEAAAKAIAAGKTLTQAALENGKPLKPVSLGWVEKKDMLAQLTELVFALKKGAMSQPIKTSLGWHILRVKNIQPGKVTTYEEAREQLRKAIAQREAVDAIFGMTNKLEDSLAAGALLDEAARQSNLKARRALSLDASGRNGAGEAVDGLPKGPSFLRTVFETPDGQDSALTETQNGGFFILHVNKVTQPKVQPLNEVRSAIITAWKGDARAKATEKHAKALVEKIKGGRSFEAVAKAEKLAIKTTPAFTRLTHDAESGLPAALMDQLFKLKPGETAMAEGPGGYTVAVLTKVRDPSSKEKADTATALAEEISQGLSGDLIQQFVGALRGRYKIETKPQLLQERP